MLLGDLRPFTSPCVRMNLDAMGDVREFIEMLRDLEQIAVETGRPEWAEELAVLRRRREAEVLVSA